MAIEPAARRAVHVYVHGDFVVARLAHPPANPLAPAVLEGLDAAADAVDSVGAYALVVASELPGYFAAGADIKHMASLNADGFAAYGVHMRHVLERIAALDAVSIAAIDGLALGGGLELALACTLRIGSMSARVGLPEVKLGLIPGAGGTQRLPRVVGRSRALDMILTGRQVAAEEAHSMGLLDRLVPSGTAEKVALEIAAQLAASSAPALAAIRTSVEAAFSEEFADGMGVEADQEQALFTQGDGREGIAAFLERRRPTFASRRTPQAPTQTDG
jgi:enoyl-CoA hydratase/carnithine racemase